MEVLRNITLSVIEKILAHLSEWQAISQLGHSIIVASFQKMCALVFRLRRPGRYLDVDTPQGGERDYSMPTAAHSKHIF